MQHILGVGEGIAEFAGRQVEHQGEQVLQLKVFSIGP